MHPTSKTIYADLFSLFDRNQSGNIDFFEFRELLKYLGLFLPHEALVQLYSEADRNHSNSINYDEF